MNRSNNEVRISPILCLLGWLSCFVLAWGWIWRAVPVDALSIVMFIFFFLVGVIAGLVGFSYPSDKKNLP